tara:strand:- start:2769 stop:3506 length:738 start_codon:yes stop_codon:yes gene_type:complete
MNIHFFEEFPTKANLNKLKLIKWPCKLFLAAHSVKEFKTLQSQVKKIKNNTKCIYWPILKKQEGYWISPFSTHKAIKRIFEEIKASPVPLMLDLELPFRKPIKFLTNLSDFFKNKKLIKETIKATKEIYSCENAIHLHYKLLGLTYNHKAHPHILMFYSSMLKKRHARSFINNTIIKHLKNKPDVWVALGTIATGILENEPILKPKSLKSDLEEMNLLKIKNIVIFRLGGINKQYIHTIKPFLKH